MTAIRKMEVERRAGKRGGHESKDEMTAIRRMEVERRVGRRCGKGSKII